MIKGKNILITGGTGFIGSHLAEMLVRQGNNVTCFDRYNINNNWGWLEESDLSKDINVILGDIRDFDSVHDATGSSGKTSDGTLRICFGHHEPRCNDSWNA